MKLRNTIITGSLLALVAAVGFHLVPEDSGSIEKNSTPGASEKRTAHRTPAIPGTALDSRIQKTSERISLRAPEEITAERAAFLASLNPRLPHPKVEPELPNRGEDFRIVVKFKDDAKARPAEDGKLSLIAEELPAELATIADTHEIEFAPYFAGIEQKMAGLEERAAENSGNAQADFRGIAVVKPDDAASSLGLATQLNALDIVEYAYLEATDVLAPPPSDIAPPTPDLTHHQTWRLNNPGHGTDYALASNAKGQGVRISVIEGAYRADHEDLADADLVNGLEQEYGDEPALNTAFSSNVDVVSEITGVTPRDHGTSTLGIICAQDNGYGVTGMAPEARVQFYSNDTQDPSLFTTASNIGLAADNSRAGDIILLEVQSDYQMGTENYGPAELDDVVWDATKLAVDAGVVVIAAAGNGGVDLDSPAAAFYMNRGDSGAIIVGAGTPNSTHNRLDFSTYGTRLNVQAWGGAVTTTGDGIYNVGGDLDQSYKNNYGGTSSASALVAAACTSLQSLQIAAFGSPMTPSSMRIRLRSHGSPQGDAATNGKVGRALDLQELIDSDYSGNPKYVVEPYQWTETFHGETLPNRLDGWRMLAEPGGGVVRNVGGALRLESLGRFAFSPKLSSATLHVRLEGREDVLLEFDHTNYQDIYQGEGVESFTGSADIDGVFMSADGVSWHRLPTPNFASLDSTNRHYRISLDQAIEDAGIEYNNDFRIRFQCFTSGEYGSLSRRGRSIDNVSVHIGEAGAIGFGAASTLISIREGESRVLSLIRTGGSEGFINVGLVAEPGSGASSSDFPEIDIRPFILDGQTSKGVTISTTEDDLPERTETFTLRLYDPGFGAKLGQFRTATIRIIDDDTEDEPGIIFHGTNTTSIGTTFDPDATGATMLAHTIEVPAGGPTSFGDVRVRINDLSHTRTSDLDIVLESPDGRRVMLMSDAGVRDFNVPDSGKLDRAYLDFAAGETPVPEFGPVGSGKFGPADHPPSPDQMLAPIGTFGGGTDLGAFDGIDPRGTWTLYIQDQWGNGGGGQLLGGWELLLNDGSAPGEFQPEITDIFIEAGQVHLQFTTRLLYSYEIQFSTDLRTWTRQTIITNASSNVTSESVPAIGEARYFRVIELGQI